MTEARILAVIPARAGSKGLPCKNIKPMAGVPLLVHTLRCAALCPGLTRTIVSTDGEDIARMARAYGGDVPFLRPEALAGDTVAMWPVLQHALAAVEAEEGRPYDLLVLLDPTSPTRLPEDVARVIEAIRTDCDTALTVSEPHFSPFWHMYVPDERGFGKPLFESSASIVRRQGLPPCYFINGLAYAWKADFIRTAETWTGGRTRMVMTPATRAVTIDTAEDFEWTEKLMSSGILRLPWMEAGAAGRPEP